MYGWGKPCNFLDVYLHFPSHGFAWALDDLDPNFIVFMQEVGTDAHSQPPTLMQPDPVSALKRGPECNPYYTQQGKQLKLACTLFIKGQALGVPGCCASCSLLNPCCLWTPIWTSSSYSYAGPTTCTTSPLTATPQIASGEEPPVAVIPDLPALTAAGVKRAADGCVCAARCSKERPVSSSEGHTAPSLPATGAIAMSYVCTCCSC